MHHEGDLEGWRHELTGAVEVAPDYYKVDVPEGGTRDVVTTIEALEGSPWSLSLHSGANDPQGRLSRGASGGTSLGVDVEYAFTRDLALEAFLGYDRFSSDLDALHLAADLRWYLRSGPVRPFVLGGLGAYRFDSGSTELGALAGVGIQVPMRPRLDFEAGVRYHRVFADPVDLEWLALHVGLRIHF